MKIQCISPYSLMQVTGGTWASKKIFNKYDIKNICSRDERKIIKYLWGVWGIVSIPWLHPVFTRYNKIILKTEEKLYLNFSGSFSVAEFKKNTVLICHDLQCHRKFLFKRWVRWSERRLLSKASKVIVMTDRDLKIVNRYYDIDLNKIDSSEDVFCEKIKSFDNTVPENPRIVFLGGLNRKENCDALSWFKENVWMHIPTKKVHVIGVRNENAESAFKDFAIFEGMVADVSALKKYDLLIAPMQSSAGVKIKIIEALEMGVAILGTKMAFSGLNRPNDLFCTNDPEIWIKVLNEGGNFTYRK